MGQGALPCTGHVLVTDTHTCDIRASENREATEWGKDKRVGRGWGRVVREILSEKGTLDQISEGREGVVLRTKSRHWGEGTASAEVLRWEYTWTNSKEISSHVQTCRCESWTNKKAESRRTDAFQLWCWRRLLRVPWTARRSNQSILKEVSPEYSLEGLMLKLKLQYFGHLM